MNFINYCNTGLGISLMKVRKINQARITWKLETWCVWNSDHLTFLVVSTDPNLFFFFFFVPSDLQVSYHLRFTFTPRNAPLVEKSELNPNSDLDWHTLSLYPLFQLPGPREQHDKEGGTPGKSLGLSLSDPRLCSSFLRLSPSFLSYMELFSLAIVVKKATDR